MSAAPKHRILFYTHALVGGGAERVWVLMASELKRRGHDVHFAVNFEAPENRSFLSEDVPLHVLGAGHWASVRALTHLMRDKKPQIAFSAVGASDLKLCLAQVLSGQQIALIPSVHGRFDMEKHLLGRINYLAMALTSRWTARTLAVSHDLKTYAVQRFFAQASKLVVIHNCTLLPEAEHVPTAQALAARPPVVIAMARLIREKGFDTVLKAFAYLPHDTQLLVLGVGPEQPHLMQLAQELGIAERVHFKGYVTHPLEFLGQAKCLVLGSACEAFGNVVVEGLGCGLPVVAFDRCGPHEIMSGYDGLGSLIAPDDIPAFAQAIRFWMESVGDPSVRRARAQNFSVERVADQYEALIKQVLQEKLYPEPQMGTNS